MTRLVVLVALFEIQLVELRMILAEGGRSHGRTWLSCFTLRTYNVENNHLVLALLQPATREIEGLLRTNLPEAAEGMTVYVNLTLAECLHINKGVAHLLDVEVATVVTRLGLKTTHLVGWHGECLHCRLVVISDGAVVPSGRGEGKFAILLLSSEGYVADDTLVVFDGTTEVDSSHTFYHDGELCTLWHGWQFE